MSFFIHTINQFSYYKISYPFISYSLAVVDGNRIPGYVWFGYIVYSLYLCVATSTNRASIYLCIYQSCGSCVIWMVNFPGRTDNIYDCRRRSNLIGSLFG